MGTTSTYFLSYIKREPILVFVNNTRREGHIKSKHISKHGVEEYISLMVYSVPDLKRISFKEAVQQEFRPTRLGEWFGPSWVIWVCNYIDRVFNVCVLIVYALVSCSDTYSRRICGRGSTAYLERRQ